MVVNNTKLGVDLLTQLTTHLRVCQSMQLKERLQIEYIRDTLLDTITETNFKRLCSILIDLQNKLGHISYGDAGGYMTKYLEYYHEKTTLENWKPFPMTKKASRRTF
jgi:hypothetical protein